jgi:DNA-binding XRE family transcriptional regulator
MTSRTRQEIEMPRAKKQAVLPPAAKHECYRVRLGKQIRQRRLALDLTQAAFADTVGISLKYLGEIERGDGNPKADMIDRLSAALGWDALSPFAAMSEADGALRDEMAKAVLPSAMANFYHAGDAWEGHDDVAKHCYTVADAMLRARQK